MRGVEQVSWEGEDSHCPEFVSEKTRWNGGREREERKKIKILRLSKGNKGVKMKNQRRRKKDFLVLESWMEEDLEEGKGHFQEISRPGTDSPKK